MRSILIQSEINSRETLIADLWQYGTTGIIEEADTVRAYFENDSLVPQALEQGGYFILEVSDEPNFVTVSNLPPNQDPIYAGEHFFVVSSYMDHPTPPGRKRLVIDAVDAFGSGSHESTQLVIQAMEEYLPPKGVALDVGCGSGILSAVAKELGSSHVFACDTHGGAVSTARKHAPNSHLFVGSVDAVAPSAADVALVNIGAVIIDRLADELHRVVKPNGLLILAGFMADRTPTSIRPEKEFQLNGWLCWLCRPETIQLTHSPRTLQPFPSQWW